MLSGFTRWRVDQLAALVERIRLDAGQTVRGAARSVGGYHREVKRVADRYNTAGLQAALSDEPRPGPERKLDSVEEAAVVAMVCGPPPEGCERWTIRLVTSEVMKRGIVKKIGRECIRVTLANHELKPCEKKCGSFRSSPASSSSGWRTSFASTRGRMTPQQPVVCFDERPVVLRDSARPGSPMRPGRVKRSDYEYVRKGTANVFCIVEPKTGKRLTRATRRRANRDFARALARISKAYRKAKRNSRTTIYALSRYHLRPLAVEIELVAHWWWRFATITLLPISY
jgi:hypothetical protein